MNTSRRFMETSLSAAAPHQPGRRDFLAALACCSAGLILGTPSFAQAGSATSLQGRVNDLVREMRSKRLILPDEQTSWSVYDFSTRTKLVSINEDEPRQAASMIKPFVAQAYFYKMDETKGKLSYTADVRRTMESMIRRSSNTATNRIMKLVSQYEGNAGPPAVERVLKAKAPGIFVQTRIVEYIPAGGGTYRNLASARDYSRFLYALWNDKLPHSSDLRALMALPNRDRITHGVNAIPDRIKVYDKTGSTARLCGNMGIVDAAASDGRSCPYTFIGIIERPSRARNYGSWITRRSNAIRAVSELVYLDQKRRHGLV